MGCMRRSPAAMGRGSTHVAVVSTGTTTLANIDWAVPVIPGGRFPSTTGMRRPQQQRPPSAGVWIREHGTDILFEDVDIYYSYTGSSDYQPFVVDPREIVVGPVRSSIRACTIHRTTRSPSTGGRNVVRFRNPSDEGGNLTNMTGGTECSGRVCDVATNQRRWWTTSDQDSSGSRRRDR